MNKSPSAQALLSPSSKSRKVSVGILGVVLATFALSQRSMCRSTRSQVQRVQLVPHFRANTSNSMPSTVRSTDSGLHAEEHDAGSDTSVVIDFNNPTDAETQTASAIAQQVFQDQHLAIMSAATAADIRDIVMDGLSRAVESDEDNPPSQLDTCARVGRSYLSSGSLRRLVTATRAACIEMRTLIQQNFADTPRAVMLAEALHQECNARDVEGFPETFQLAIAQGRFDLVTATLQDRMNAMHERMACHPDEMVGAGNAPRKYIETEVLTLFINRHPGHLADLTWNWTPNLLDSAELAITSSGIVSIPRQDSGIDNDALRRDSEFVQAHLLRSNPSDASVVVR